ncbi:MAG: polymer-forming cytoskeletal protein [Lachnospiraceae bacterium]|nr:polymer-forming cytoskeletal protein [Lachnospiraceae bacterium]MBP1585304.1 polymer-forming cytoskeletal protein [Lachnospiraceae bacterium]
MKNQKLNITTLIGKGSVMDGDFATPGSARIDGKITGNVNVEGVLVLGISGAIRGNVKCSSIIIGGEIEGNIIAPERAELSPSSRVIGDIRTDSIIIDEKAVFHGKCVMDEEMLTSRDTESFAFKSMERKDSRVASSEVKDALEEASENKPEPVTNPVPAEHGLDDVPPVPLLNTGNEELKIAAEPEPEVLEEEIEESIEEDADPEERNDIE